MTLTNSATNGEAVAKTPRPENPSIEFDKTAEEITRWLEVLTLPARLLLLKFAIELRVPKYSPGGRRPFTQSGFFDFDHLYDMARRALALERRSPGVYWTINPVSHDLLSRRNNRDDAANDSSLAHDVDVIRRVWMLVDVDPVRPAEMSSTDSEKAAAFGVMERVLDDRSQAGWPDPILADSGNGFHALYPIDLPADDGGIVRDCLRALTKFNTAAAKVDTSVFNASRICKVYGTKSRKGDSTTERPHRRSKIISIPEELQP